MFNLRMSPNIFLSTRVTGIGLQKLLQGGRILDMFWRTRYATEIPVTSIEGHNTAGFLKP